MSITVGIHPDKFETEFFEKRPGNPRPFATLGAYEERGKVTLFLFSPAQCDELIKSAVEAKRLLLGDASDVGPAAPCGDPYCTTCGGDVRAKRDLDGNLVHMLTWEQLGTAPHPVTLGWREKDAHGRYDAASAAEVAQGVEPWGPDDPAAGMWTGNTEAIDDARTGTSLNPTAPGPDCAVPDDRELWFCRECKEFHAPGSCYQLPSASIPADGA